MSDIKKDHSIGEGTGAVTGAVTGAAVGSAAGPVGTVVGAIAGGVLGAQGRRFDRRSRQPDRIQRSLEEQLPRHRRTTTTAANGRTTSRPTSTATTPTASIAVRSSTTSNPTSSATGNRGKANSRLAWTEAKGAVQRRLALHRTRHAGRRRPRRSLIAIARTRGANAPQDEPGQPGRKGRHVRPLLLSTGRFHQH